MPPDVSRIANVEYEQCHKSFHMSLVAACGSNTLLRLWNQLYNESNRYRYISRMSPYERPDVNEEHAQIVEAVLARDSDLAVQRIVAHYSRTGAFLSGTEPADSRSTPSTTRGGNRRKQASS